MNDQLQTTDQPKKESGSSSMKQFMLTLLATTISIALTFGTSAIIENNKKKNEKREIVMMVMYDLYTSLKMVQQADSNVFSLLNLQREFAQDTTVFEQKRFVFVHLLPTTEFTDATEKIFSSSIETINTVGNVLFAENVAQFYYCRNYYRHAVCDSIHSVFWRDDGNAMRNLKDFLDVDIFTFAILSHGLYLDLKNYYDECKLLMNVSDEEIEVYRKKKRLIEKNLTDPQNQIDSRMKEMRQISEDIMEGMKKHHLY